MPPKRIIHRIRKFVEPRIAAVKPKKAEEVLPADKHLRKLHSKFKSNMRRGIIGVHVKGYRGGTSMIAIHETPDGIIGMDNEGNVYRIGERATFLMPKRKLDKRLGR